MHNQTKNIFRAAQRLRSSSAAPEITHNSAAPAVIFCSSGDYTQQRSACGHLLQLRRLHTKNILFHWFSLSVSHPFFEAQAIFGYSSSLTFGRTLGGCPTIGFQSQRPHL